MEQITSTANPRVKEVIQLGEKSRSRRETGLFTVEGRREISACLRGGFTAKTVFYCPQIISEDEVSALFADAAAELVTISQNVYSRMAYRGTTEGILAVFRSRERGLKELRLASGKAPFVIVLESVEKPGNLGAVLRTADASGAAAVIVCDPLTDLYNPNLIRASIGGIFTVPVAACSSEEAYEWLHSAGFQILTAQLQDSSPYYDIDFKRPTAVVFGTESTGLREFWRERSDRKIMIPMLGKLDSLNVSTSVAILSYEAVRQKQAAS
jgi:TrmH family RNA methyltransferase